MATTRRAFLTRTLPAVAGGSLLAASSLGLNATRRQPADRWPIAFVDEGRSAVGERIGIGHQARLAFDLATLTPTRLVTPTDEFFIRTGYPDRLDPDAADQWTIRLSGSSGTTRRLRLADLDNAVEPQGTHLLECSGNGPRRAFGLLSAATWDGIALERIFATVRIDRRHTHVLIGGYDERDRGFVRASAGASWIFPIEELLSAKAFLATTMNGRPLPLDHGYPVRLVVPGWYGCTNAKWVDTIQFVEPSTAPTPHMREYARRTHQDDAPATAADFIPATIDVAALPVRVDAFHENERLTCELTGIVWGGTITDPPLRIRLTHAGAPAEATPWQAVDRAPRPSSSTWSLWTHRWHPPATGHYTVSLALADPSARTRRLDRGYYDRTIAVTAG